MTKQLRFLMVIAALFFSLNLKAGTDLTITNPILNSATVEAGNTISVDFTLKNSGNTAAGLSYTGLYLSLDSIYDAGDIYLTSKYSTGLSFNSSETITNQILTIPQNTRTGNYYLVFKADYDADVNEDNEFNNTNHLALTVAPSLARDLTVTINSSASSVEQGNTLSVNITLSNLEPGAVGPNFTGLFLSSNTLYDAQDISITEFVYNSGLAGNGNQIISVSGQIPLTTPPGNYYLIVKADVNQNVLESDESNNIANVAVTIAPSSSNKDLTISSLVSPNPESGGYFTITYNLNNTGASAAGSNFSGYYLSSNSTYDASDVYLGSTSMAPLSGNSSRSNSANILLPPNTAPGAYYLLCRADYSSLVTETDETNNVTSVAITVTAPAKDLTIFNLSVSASSVERGNHFDVTYTLKNIGTGNPGGYYTGVYLSSDNTLSADDQQMTIFYHTTPVAGTNYTFTETVPVSPFTVAGNYYLILKCDNTNLVNETNENNNTTSIAFTVPPFSDHSDLTIGYLSVYPTTQEAGGVIAAYFSLNNIGTSAMLYFTKTSVYLSTNTSYDAGDILLTQMDECILASGDHFDHYPNLVIPHSTVPGNYYIIVRADATDVVTETNENNNTNYAAIQIIAPADRDLRITNQSMVSSVEAGTIMQISYTLENIGTAPCDPSSAGYYISSDNIWDANDEYLGNFNHNNLNPGGTEDNLNNDLYIPDYIPAGNYYLIIKADDYNEVLEVNENNNTSSLPLTVIGPDVDITVSGISLANSNISTGVTEKVTFTINNSGGTSAGFNFSAIYISTNTTWDASDVLVNDGIFLPEILPGSSADFIDYEFSIPTTVVTGNYYLVFKADKDNYVYESNEYNNTNYIAVSVTGIPLPDLTYTNLTLPSSTIETGSGMWLNANLKNNGNDVAYYVNSSIYFSSDAVLDQNDALLWSFTNLFPLSPGDYETEYIPVNIPTGLTAGTYYLILSADSDKNIIEGNENNNEASIAVNVVVNGNKDLVIDSTKASDAVEPGDLVEFEYYVKNLGSSNVGSSVTSVYLSTNTTLDAGDVNLFTDYPYGLYAGDSYWSSQMLVQLDAATPLGLYYLIFVADENDDVVESNESNNIAYLPLRVVGPGSEDLKINSPSVSASTVTSGATVNLDFILKNSGVTTINTSVAGIYFSSDNQYDAGDVLLANYSQSSALSAGISETAQNISVVIPANATNGNYYLIIFADKDNLISEIDEVNNFASIAITVDNTLSNLDRAKMNYGSVELFPNPSNQLINFKVEKSLVTSDDVISIFNSLGEKIDERSVDSEMFSLNVSELPEGLYTYRINHAGMSGNFMVIK